MAERYRIKFEKLELMRFVGHLDLLKIFERAVRRAGIPVAFSAGFNRHQLFSIAQPLPLGMESMGEYADIELERRMPPAEIMSSLNSSFPDGLRCLLVRELEQNEKNSAAVLAAAVYKIRLSGLSAPTDRIRELLEQKEIIVMKKSKRLEAQVDIRPDILRLDQYPGEDETVLRALLAAGGHRNLKPELVVRALCGRDDGQMEKEARYSRLDMYRYREGELVQL